MIEGTHLLAEYLERGGRPVELLVTEAALSRSDVAALVRRAGRTPVVLAEGLFGTVADAESPSGLAAEIAIPQAACELASVSLCVFLDGIQDAGNVGTILRSAAAFGATAAVCSPGCADPWSPKALRGAMGGHFRLDILLRADLEQEIARFGGLTVCAVPRGGIPLNEIELAGRVGWVFGAEGRGVSEAVAARVSRRATIPMAEGVESLNVGAAAAICLYETFRQRTGVAGR